MNNLNVVSTPEITGNIGSCKTEVTSVISGRPSFWYYNTKEIATNSCTGEVQQFDNWNISVIGILTPLVIVAVLLVSLGIWAENS